MKIGRKDVLWNYGATFLKIASSALLLPFILNKMPSETVGVWSVFMTITAFASLLDFGFNSSFTRNVTYVFSGVKKLKINGFETVNEDDVIIDYGLLKGVISSMRWFYSRISIVLFFLLATLGTYYIYILLKEYNYNQREVYIAWILLCCISTYNLYTLYYDSLLQGKGLIKRSKQIIIIGQTVYLVVAAFFIILGYGLVAIISAQAASVIIVRWLSYHSFFTKELRLNLLNSQPHPKREVLSAVYPNALKMGLTSLGGFMVTRSATIIGSLYLPLNDIASYGISMQLILVVASLAGIFTITYRPQIAQLRVSQNSERIKNLYLKGQAILLLTYIAGGIIILFLGDWALRLIRSQTFLMPSVVLATAIFVSFIETNLGIAGSILLTKNEVPFFKASIISGILIVLGLLLGFRLFEWGLWTMVFVPLIIDISYQAWKWPLEVKKELAITKDDFNLKILFH